MPKTIHAVQPDDGEGYWRPKPANGYVVVKVSPRRGGQKNLAMGIQVIPPGGFVPEHSHEKQEEILFCFEGEGVVEVDGTPHAFVPGTTIYASWVAEAINRVTNEFELNMDDHPMPHNGALATLGTVTYPTP